MSQAPKSFDIHIIMGSNFSNKCEYTGVFIGALIFLFFVGVFHIVGVFFVGVPHEICTR